MVTARRLVIALVLIVVAALVIVHLRTKIVTLGYELGRSQSGCRKLQHEIEKQRAALAGLTSPASMARRREKTKVNLEGPQHATNFAETERTELEQP